MVVFIIGLGLLTLGSNARLSGKRQMALSGATTMANDGIEYGYWQVADRGASLPTTFGYASSNNGFTLKFTVTATDNSANVPGTIKLVSTGTQSGDSVTLTRVMAKGSAQKTVFDYALCSGSSLNTFQTITTGANGANGDIGADGSISLRNRSGTINGDAFATGGISIRNITGNTSSNSTAITFPAINTTYYQSIAVQTYNGDQTFTGGFTFPPPSSGVYPVVIINGNITISSGTVSGVGTVVVTGNITFTGNLSYLYSTDKLAVLGGGSLINAAPAGTSLSIAGFYYLHNSSGTAMLQQSNTAPMTISGGLAADTYNVTGPLVSNHDPAMNAALGKQLHLPGY